MVDTTKEKEVKRLRFGPEDDLALLRAFVNINPLEEPEKWEEIQTNIYIITGKKFSVRTLKDHLFLILQIWLKKDKGDQIRSGVEEIYSERDQLLQEVNDMCNSANVKPLNKKRKISKEKQIADLGKRAREECAKSLIEKKENSLLHCSSDHEYAFQTVIENEVEISSKETTEQSKETTEQSKETTEHVEIVPLEPVPQSSETATLQRPKMIQGGERRILGPSRTKTNKSRAVKSTALNYLQNKEAKENIIKSRQLDLEEEKLSLERKRISLDEQRLEMEKMERKDRSDIEKMRFNHEMFVRDEKNNIIEQQNQLIQLLMERLRKYEEQ